MCNHLFAVNCCHGGEREEVGTTELIVELQRTDGRYKPERVHKVASPESLGQYMDWFDYCPRCGIPLLTEIQAACDMVNAK